MNIHDVTDSLVLHGGLCWSLPSVFIHVKKKTYSLLFSHLTFHNLFLDVKVKRCCCWATTAAASRTLSHFPSTAWRNMNEDRPRCVVWSQLRTISGSSLKAPKVPPLSGTRSQGPEEALVSGLIQWTWTWPFNTMHHAGQLWQNGTFETWKHFCDIPLSWIHLGSPGGAVSSARFYCHF